MSSSGARSRLTRLIGRRLLNTLITNASVEKMKNAFDFKLLGQQKKGSRDTYVLEAMPRPGYQPVNTETEVLTGMQGKLWIDKKSFEWVRVEAQVVRPVTIEGFLARVEP